MSHDISIQNFEQANDVIKFIKSPVVKKLYIKNGNVGEEFQRYLVVYFDSRWGRSIIHTNLTEILNQHSCDTFTPGLKSDIPLNYGFISHFRTVIDGFYKEIMVFYLKMFFLILSIIYFCSILLENSRKLFSIKILPKPINSLTLF